MYGIFPYIGVVSVLNVGIHGVFGYVGHSLHVSSCPNQFCELEIDCFIFNTGMP